MKRQFVDQDDRESGKRRKLPDGHVKLPIITKQQNFSLLSPYAIAILPNYMSAADCLRLLTLCKAYVLPIRAQMQRLCMAANPFPEGVRIINAFIVQYIENGHMPLVRYRYHVAEELTIERVEMLRGLKPAVIALFAPSMKRLPAIGYNPRNIPYANPLCYSWVRTCTLKFKDHATAFLEHWTIDYHVRYDRGSTVFIGGPRIKLFIRWIKQVRSHKICNPPTWEVFWNKAQHIILSKIRTTKSHTAKEYEASLVLRESSDPR